MKNFSFCKPLRRSRYQASCRGRHYQNVLTRLTNIGSSMDFAIVAKVYVFVHHLGSATHLLEMKNQMKMRTIVKLVPWYG